MPQGGVQAGLHFFFCRLRSKQVEAGVLILAAMVYVTAVTLLSFERLGHSGHKREHNSFDLLHLFYGSCHLHVPHVVLQMADFVRDLGLAGTKNTTLYIIVVLFCYFVLFWKIFFQLSLNYGNVNTIINLLLTTGSAHRTPFGAGQWRIPCPSLKFSLPDDSWSPSRLLECGLPHLFYINKYESVCFCKKKIIKRQSASVCNLCNTIVIIMTIVKASQRYPCIRYTYTKFIFIIITIKQ